MEFPLASPGSTVVSTPITGFTFWNEKNYTFLADQCKEIVQIVTISGCDLLQLTYWWAHQVVSLAWLMTMNSGNLEFKVSSFVSMANANSQITIRQKMEFTNQTDWTQAYVNQPCRKVHFSQNRTHVTICFPSAIYHNFSFIFPTRSIPLSCASCDDALHRRWFSVPTVPKKIKK